MPPSITALHEYPQQRSPARRAPRVRRWLAWRNEAGTVAGFFSIELASGLIVHDCKLMVGPQGRPWVAMPSQKQLNRDGSPRTDANGKAVWSDVVDFRDRNTRERFLTLALDAPRSAHPEAFEGSALARGPP